MAKRVVLINPVTKQIDKIYNSAKEAGDDLGINRDSIYGCLNHKVHHIFHYILKYENDASISNIKKWSDRVAWSSDGMRKCPMCQNWFNVEDIPKDYCKPCGIISRNNYSATSNGFFKQMIGLMNSRSKGQKDKIKRVCELTYDDILEIYNNQEGKCYYSGIKLEIKRLSNWQCSPERLNQSNGYTKDNTKLICLEFNIGQRQWTPEKIKKIKLLIESKVDMNELSNIIENAKFIKKGDTMRKQTIANDNIIYYQCAKCLVFLSDDKYTYSNNNGKPRLSSYCIDCQKIHREEYNGSLRGFILRKLGNAKLAGRRKSDKRNNTCKEFNLTFDDICNMIIKQNGRCYYSGIPLIYKPNSDWMCSIERIDNKLGYTNENCVLVCVEFNSSDHTQLTTNKICGSSQWSKEKFNYFLKHLNDQ